MGGIRIKIFKWAIFVSYGIIAFVLNIISVILKLLLAPILFLYSNITILCIKDRALRDAHFDKYYRDLALLNDVYGNILGKYLFNKILIKKDGYKFGRKYETISSILGKNKRLNTLTFLGKILCAILNAIDKNHCEKSINDNQGCLDKDPFIDAD